MTTVVPVQVPVSAPTTISDADSNDPNARHAAYLRRIRDFVRVGTRYTAYTSEVGEAFRPVVRPWIVTAAYGISWAYIIGDVGVTTYRAYETGPTPSQARRFDETTRLGLVAARQSVFQTFASMALPAFTIHTVVKQTARLFVNSTLRVRRWGPTAIGIAVVPALPYLFDHPVEVATDLVFDKIEDAIAREPEDKP